MKSKQVCQFPTNISEKEGATVAATPTFSQRAASCGQDGQRSSMETFNFIGKPHKIPQMSYLRETRFSDSTDWPSKTEETTNETNKMQMSLRTD